ncbi:hypothetical protein B0H67DRAFT_316136 [Lasiosphaeris hirsuta]|uniref:HNH nuclease domain-containing protein n=1 Tax=Lasiosphaeris hirsuta TaxID=260670 RepID=A0AA40A1J7_9PEZI|nr:hypothetical protein B0H67DRAFT_316136 [Lasiosphaeris hirsuta]
MSSDTSADLLGQYTDFLTSNPSRSDRKILKETFCFIKREQTELDRQTLSGFLESDPPKESSKGILPLDELTERVELIAKIEDKIQVRDEDYEFGDHGFAALLVTPLEVLRLANNSPRIGTRTMMQSIRLGLGIISDFVRLFLTRDDSNTKVKTDIELESSVLTSSRKRKNIAKSVAPSQKRPKKDGDPKYIPGTVDVTGKHNRYKNQAWLRQGLDSRRYVITGTADPDVCHIIPHSTCARPETLSRFRQCFGDVSILISDCDEASLNEWNGWFTARLGVSDQAWNMISLNTQLHKWWGKAHLGFKCQGILPGLTDEQQLVRLQFHWLPRALSGVRDEQDLQIHLKNTWNLREGVAAFRTTARLVATGDILDVVVAAEDAFKMKRAFDLQWALIRIAALTGTADVNDDVVDTDDSGPPGEGLIEESIDIRSWLDGIVPSNGDDDNDDDDNDDSVHDNTSKLPITLSIQARGLLEQQDHLPASIPASNAALKENQSPMPAPNPVPGSTEETQERVPDLMDTVFGNQFLP